MIVEAVGIAVNSANEETKAALEEAMMAAVKKAQAEGETDNDKIRELILEARDKVLNDYNS